MEFYGIFMHELSKSGVQKKCTRSGFVSLASQYDMQMQKGRGEGRGGEKIMERNERR